MQHRFFFDRAQTPPSSPVNQLNAAPKQAHLEWVSLRTTLPLAHQVLILPPGPLESCEKLEEKKKENVPVNISGAGFMAVLSHGVMTGLVLA